MKEVRQRNIPKTTRSCYNARGLMNFGARGRTNIAISIQRMRVTVNRIEVEADNWHLTNDHTWLTEGLHSEFETFIPLGTKEAKAAKG